MVNSTPAWAGSRSRRASPIALAGVQNPPSTGSSSSTRLSALSPSIFDVALELLTPRLGQTPEERGKELLGALPAELRRDLTKLLRLVLPPTLPPFPRS